MKLSVELNPTKHSASNKRLQQTSTAARLCRLPLALAAEARYVERTRC